MLNQATLTCVKPCSKHLKVHHTLNKFVQYHIRFAIHSHFTPHLICGSHINILPAHLCTQHCICYFKIDMLKHTFLNFFLDCLSELIVKVKKM